MKRTQLAAAIVLATSSISAWGATYSVTPLPQQTISANNFAYSIDESGYMLTVVDTEFNPPVDLETLTNDTSFFELIGPELENLEDAQQGIFTPADYTRVVAFLVQSQNAAVGQKLTQYRSYFTDTQDSSLVPGFDVVTPLFNDYTQSVTAQGRDSLNGDFVVGDSTGLVVREPYTDNDGDVINYTYPEHPMRGFVQVGGVTTPLLSTDQTLGGFSMARAINSNLQVAGFGAVSFLEEVTSAVENCADDDLRGDFPIGLCNSNIYNSRFEIFEVSQRLASTTSRFVFGSELNATLWQLDASGGVIETQTYPLLHTPEEDSTLFRYTIALDINNAGIAVGEGTTGELVEINRPAASAFNNELERVATVYRDGETIELLPRDDNLISQAVAINDNNWVVGALLRNTSDISRSQLFAYNLDSETQLLPAGFFGGTEVNPSAINNNNIVVGRAENEVSSDTDSIRQTSAFMYDIDTEEFVDLNDLTSCDSPYTLLEAVDINDNNEIIANARLKRNSKYVTGEDIISDDGETFPTDTIIAVKLTPIANGTIDECDVDPDDQPYERSGASTSLLTLLTGALFVLFRRRVRK